MSREIRVVVAGLGTVGTAVVRLLQQESARYRERVGVALRLSLILDRSYQRKDMSWLGSDVRVTDSLEEFLRAPSDIVVELIGGADPADRIITASLTQQKAVITANKLLMARSASQYFQLALEHNAYLGFEAAVAGGIPIIRVLRRSFFGDRIVRLRGILNGTCNFILSEMAESGRDFQEVLEQAQALGYAEADPVLDISGRDTSDKLAILSSLAFGIPIVPDQIPTQGITELSPVDFLYARKLDCTIKLLGLAERKDHDVCLRVSPFLTQRRLALSSVSGVLNAVEVTGAMLGSAVLSGQGAGGDPTAVSVMADILNAARWKQREGRLPGQPPLIRLEPAGTEAAAGQHSGLQTLNSTETFPYYIRFFVKDRPGIIAAVAHILARWQISIVSVLQEKWPDHSNLPFVITVEPTLSSTMRKTLSELSQFEFNTTSPLALPILDH